MDLTQAVPQVTFKVTTFLNVMGHTLTEILLKTVSDVEKKELTSTFFYSVVMCSQISVILLK